MTDFMQELQVSMFGYPKWFDEKTSKPPFKKGDMVNIVSLNGVSADKETVAMLRKPWKVTGCVPAYVSTELWDIELEDNPYLFTSDDVEKV